MKQSAAAKLCGLLLGAAMALVPGRSAAADAVHESSAAPSDGRFGRVIDELADSIASPIGTFGLHAHSYHTKIYASTYTRDHDRDGPLRKFNNQTRGLYVVNEGGWAAGIYRNSVHRATVYGGRLLDVWGPLQVAVGVATGYNEGIVPMIVPTLHLGPVRLWVQPAIGGPNNATMVHLSLEYQR